MINDRYRRYGLPRPCRFLYTDRPAKRNQSVATCGCCTFAAFGVPDKATGKTLWEKHIEDAQAGITPEPKIHQ